MPDHPTEVLLELPATAEFLRLARLAAADLGSRAGFTYDEIEDLRIGVDELCHSVMSVGGRGTVALRYLLYDDHLVVEGHGPPVEHGREDKRSELSKTIVAAVVDEHELARDGDGLRFRLVKHLRH
jgi:serine/threonine-protein kinase RsbW